MRAQQNVDPVEISKFSELAHRWWDKDSEFKPLHDINPLRLGYIEQFAELQDKKVLDVGCGGGILSEAMAKAGAHVTGIDMAEASLNVAQLHALDGKLDIDYHNVSVEDYAIENAGLFDVVTCLELLEHVPDPASIVKSCAALAKPSGQVFFSTINRNPKSWFMAIAGAEYVLNLVPKGTHEFKRFLKPSELASFARSAELKIQDLTGMGYNPLTRQYSLNKDINVNYLMSCQNQ